MMKIHGVNTQDEDAPGVRIEMIQGDSCSELCIEVNRRLARGFRTFHGVLLKSSTIEMVATILFSRVGAQPSE